MSKGLVSLIGAGPGDPELLTLKAMKRLGQADLVVYDYLANPEHLRHARSSARRLCVGKDFRHRSLSQEKVNRLIVRESAKGRRVTRLKGGDPYLFGRGGEEALFLKKNGIPFEVIPGVTSATACAAYAGIPLTHRDHNAVVTFLTGHRAGDARLDTIDWGKIVSVSSTIVVYMGFYNLGLIVERLIEAGLKTSTPVAVIEWGTLPKQRSCQGALESITNIVKKMALKPPAIIIIGDVVSLRDKLNWFEKLPLFGKTVVVTRMKEKAGILSDQLSALGAQVIEYPVIRILPAGNFKGLDRAIKQIKAFQWVVFTSAYGVDAFFRRLFKQHRRDSRALGGVRIACVGPETSLALERYGLRADLKPSRFETAALVRAFRARLRGITPQRVLLVRTDIAGDEFQRGLERLKARVESVVAYRTRSAGPAPAELKRRVLTGRVDAVTFTSASTVKHFIGSLGLANVKKLSKTCKFMTIGPVTSAALAGCGLKVSGQAAKFTIDGLTEMIRKKL